jgi:hypothetical protein
MADQKKVINLPKKLIIDPNQWNYRDFMAFQRAMNKDPRKAFAKAQEVIIEWGYEGDPKAKNAIANLPVEDSAKVVRTLLETINAALEQVSKNDVKVDLHGWTSIRMWDFYEVLSNFDYSAIESMVHEVASIEGVKKGDTLPLVEGAKMVEAIQERYKAIMSGKS